MEEQIAYSKHKFDSLLEECMLSMTLGFPGEMSRRSVLTLWRSLVFSKGFCHHDLKAICESGHNNLFKACVHCFLSNFYFFTQW